MRERCPARDRDQLDRFLPAGLRRVTRGTVSDALSFGAHAHPARDRRGVLGASISNAPRSRRPRDRHGGHHGERNGPHRRALQEKTSEHHGTAKSSGVASITFSIDRHPERWLHAVTFVVTETLGYPYFLQQFGQTTWNAASGPDLTLADARVGAAMGRAARDNGFFRARWDRATRAEQRYLRAMSADGDAGVPPGSRDPARQRHQQLRPGPREPALQRPHLRTRTRHRRLHRPRHGRVHPAATRTVDPPLPQGEQGETVNGLASA